MPHFQWPWPGSYRGECKCRSNGATRGDVAEVEAARNYTNSVCANTSTPILLHIAGCLLQEILMQAVTLCTIMNQWLSMTCINSALSVITSDIYIADSQPAPVAATTLNPSCHGFKYHPRYLRESSHT